MRFLTRALTGLVLTALTLGLLAFAGLSLRDALRERAARAPGERPAEEQVFAATVVEVTPGTITPVLETFGEVRARRELQVRSTAEGRVLDIGPGVEEGGRVTRGQLLFAIDPVDAETELSLAQADLADARAEVEDARRAADIATDDLAAAREQAELREGALGRQRDLEGRGVATAAAVEEAELAAASARSQVLAARQAEADAIRRIALAETALDRRRIAVEDARRNRDDTRIAAEFAGTISELSATQGGLVSQNEQLAVLIDPERLEVAFRVSTTDYLRLLDETGALTAEMATVYMEVGGFTLSSPATITREAPSVAEGESGRRLFARIEAPRGFRPGDFARVRIEEPPLEGVARLPAGAVGRDGSVLVVGAEDRLELAQVERLRTQGDEVIVRAPDLAGATVVAERTPTLGPGIRIRPLETGPDPADATGTDEGPETVGELMELSPERRAALVATVEADESMGSAARARVLSALQRPQVPARIVERIERRRDG